MFLNTSWSNNTSTQASYPRRKKKCKGKNMLKCSAFVQNQCVGQVCPSTVVAGPVQWCVALVVSEVCVGVR